MKALIVVDVQNDFCPGGSLAVKNGDEVVPIINKLLPNFDLVVFTMDWHVSDNIGFASRHGVQPFEKVDGETVWPDHCVQNTKGAELHPGLDLSKCKKDFYIYKKGEFEHPYSAFRDFAGEEDIWPELVQILDNKGVDEIFVCGLATDYCVKETAIDGKDAYGYDTTVIIDACRAISNDLKPTLEAFLDYDIKVIDSSDPDLFNVI